MDRRYVLGTVAAFTTACATQLPHTAALNADYWLKERGPVRTVTLPSYDRTVAAWQLPPQNPWAPYAKFTLLTALTALKEQGEQVELPDVSKLVTVNNAVAAAAQLATTGLPDEAMWVVDLRGPAAVAFGSYLSLRTPRPVSVVPTFNNWPAENELVPAEETLAALSTMLPQPPPPEQEERIAIRQHSQNPDDPPPDTAYIADENNTVEEETVAEVTNLHRDDQETSVGAELQEATEPHEEQGNADEADLAEADDVEGSHERRPTPEEAQQRPRERPSTQTRAEGRTTADAPPDSRAERTPGGDGAAGAVARRVAAQQGRAGGGDPSAGGAAALLAAANGDWTLRTPGSLGAGGGDGVGAVENTRVEGAAKAGPARMGAVAEGRGEERIGGALEGGRRGLCVEGAGARHGAGTRSRPTGRCAACASPGRSCG